MSAPTLDAVTIGLVQEALQAHGLYDAPIDRRWGPLTEIAMSQYRRRTEPQEGFAGGRWPLDTDAAILRFYGSPGEGAMASITLPYPMRLAWAPHITVAGTRCHELVAKDLVAILAEIASQAGGIEEVRKLGLDLFGGIYNYRAMRGGKRLSRHSWGIAIDLNPDANGNRTPWHPDKVGKAGFAAMPNWVVEVFENHGWTSYGRALGRDAMHFQATSHT